LEELTEDKRLLVQLVETLRSSSNEHVVRLLDLIRNKRASLDEIKAYVDGKVTDSEIETTPELQEVHDELEARATRRSSRRLLDVTWLSNIPVVEVPAHPWTTVTDDDGLVSFLISLWLTWSHPFCNWIDRDLFIRDMRSKNTSSAFCSPFLVNSILTKASFYCDYPEVFEDPNDPESRGMHFYREAKQRFEQEDGRITIPTIQGYATLLTSTALIGKDRLVWLSLGQLGRMAADISSSNLPMQLHSDENKRAEGRAIDNTIWGVYNLTASDHLSPSTFKKAVLRERFVC
jgi:DNA-binding transcriptional MerR regulator